MVALAPVAVVVHPAQPMTVLAELVALAKQMPGKLNYGSAGAGTPGHLTGEMFKAAAGIDIQHVPYKGSAPALTDLIGGQIQIMFDPLAIGAVECAGRKRCGRWRFQARRDRRFCPMCRPSPSPATTASRPPPGGACLRRPGCPKPSRPRLAGEIERIVHSDGFRSKLEPLGVLRHRHQR